MLTISRHKKAVIVKGDTMALKEVLKANGGRWNRTLGGWVFASSELDRVRAALSKVPGGLVDELAGGAEASSSPSSSSSSSPAVPPAKRAKTEPDEDVFAPPPAPPSPPSVSSAGIKHEVTSDSGGGAAAAAATSAVLKNNELAISEYKRASVAPFKGVVRVDLRTYYKHKDTGELRPTPKGISLSTSEWAQLKTHMDAIDRMIQMQSE